MYTKMLSVHGSSVLTVNVHDLKNITVIHGMANMIHSIMNTLLAKTTESHFV